MNYITKQHRDTMNKIMKIYTTVDRAGDEEYIDINNETTTIRQTAVGFLGIGIDIQRDIMETLASNTLDDTIDNFVHIRHHLNDDNNIKQILHYKNQMEIYDSICRSINDIVKEANHFITFWNARENAKKIDIIDEIA